MPPPPLSLPSLPGPPPHARSGAQLGGGMLKARSSRSCPRVCTPSVCLERARAGTWRWHGSALVGCGPGMQGAFLGSRSGAGASKPAGCGAWARSSSLHQPLEAPGTDFAAGQRAQAPQLLGDVQKLGPSTRELLHQQRGCRGAHPRPGNHAESGAKPPSGQSARLLRPEKLSEILRKQPRRG